MELYCILMLWCFPCTGPCHIITFIISFIYPFRPSNNFTWKSKAKQITLYTLHIYLILIQRHLISRWIGVHFLWKSVPNQLIYPCLSFLNIYHISYLYLALSYTYSIDGLHTIFRLSKLLYFVEQELSKEKVNFCLKPQHEFVIFCKTTNKYTDYTVI